MLPLRVLLLVAVFLVNVHGKAVEVEDALDNGREAADDMLITDRKRSEVHLAEMVQQLAHRINQFIVDHMGASYADIMKAKRHHSFAVSSDNVINTMRALMHNVNKYIVPNMKTKHMILGKAPKTMKQECPSCGENEQCSCKPGFFGEDCQPPVCEIPCGDFGKCTAPNNCSCNVGYLGAPCAPVCSKPCGENGKCTAPDTCTCDEGFFGPACKPPVCVAPCGENGKCTAPDVCTCDKGYGGLPCEPVCDHECHEHEKCSAPGGECVCDDGYFGEPCALPTCDPAAETKKSVRSQTNAPVKRDTVGDPCAEPVCDPVCDPDYHIECTDTNTCTCQKAWLKKNESDTECMYFYDKECEADAECGWGDGRSPDKGDAQKYMCNPETKKCGCRLPWFYQKENDEEYERCGNCFGEQWFGSRFLKIHKNFENNTHQVCKNFCKEQKDSNGNVYKFAGVENGKECWCGSDFDPHSNKRSEACTMPCPGNKKEMCGGFYAINIFPVEGPDHDHDD